MLRRLLVTGVATALTITAAVAAGPGFELTRSSIDGGGVMFSTGGGFELGGTIGQSDAGEMSGGQFTLTGGFWIEIPLGDCEDDGDVDLFDHEMFTSCLTGPDGQVEDSACLCFDVDRSRSIDLADYAIIQGNHTGSGRGIPFGF